MEVYKFADEAKISFEQKEGKDEAERRACKLSNWVDVRSL